ncbi:MAG: cupredoxin domain-containing protein [Acidimicrobiia bacterium]
MQRPLVVIAVPLVALGLAACGSSGGSKSSGSGSGPYGGRSAKKTSNTTAAPAAAGGQVTTLTAKDFSYTPTSADLAANGATIHVSNSGAVKHNLTIKGLKVDKDLPPGSSFDIDVSAKPGTYEFHCEYHPTQMKGTITVP